MKTYLHIDIDVSEDREHCLKKCPWFRGRFKHGMSSDMVCVMWDRILAGKKRPERCAPCIRYEVLEVMKREAEKLR